MREGGRVGGREGGREEEREGGRASTFLDSKEGQPNG